MLGNDNEIITGLLQSVLLCLQPPLCCSSVNLWQTNGASHQGNLLVFPVPELPSSFLSENPQAAVSLHQKEEEVEFTVTLTYKTTPQYHT